MDPEDSPWKDIPSSSRSNSSTRHGAVGASSTTSANDTPTNIPVSAPTTRPGQASGRKGPRVGKKIAVTVQPLETGDGAIDALGPLGNHSKEDSHPKSPPSPPSKEQHHSIQANRPSTLNPRGASKGNELNQTDRLSTPSDGTANKARNDTSASISSPALSQCHLPSLSVEQAARPSFQISVGDPHKVGDLTSSHIQYQVRTKTTSKAYRQPEFVVTRRYRDFLWLYESLHNNNPGIVVPPPPDKQAVGRFDSNFVESRRAALERMLMKTSAHPTLQHDADLKIFLESDAFHVDVKHREHREIGLGENKGVLSSLGLGGSTSVKFLEHDDWFHDRKIYLDALETRLKALLKSIDLVVMQRKSLAEATGDFAGSLRGLSTVELSPALSDPLAGLSDLQGRIKELHERQAQQDVLTLGITIDEYIRLIASIKMAFSQRQKSYQSWHNAEAELQKRQAAQDRLLRSGKSQQDKIHASQADVGDAEKRCHQARLLFEDLGRLMRVELDRFEREKVEDFKCGVETFLEGAIEAQKELIELWETFLMQFDADEDAEPSEEPAIRTEGPSSEDTNLAVKSEARLSQSMTAKQQDTPSGPTIEQEA